MKVTVVHTAFEDAPQIVAEVNSPHAKVEEALEYYVPKMTDRGFVKKLLTIMELGIPLTTIANSIQTASVMEGKHSIDVGVLAAPILVELMKNIGEANEVSYVVGTGQDDMKDRASIALANKKGDINLSIRQLLDLGIETLIVK